MTRSATFVFAPGNVVIHLEVGYRGIVRVTFFKMSIYARSGRLGQRNPIMSPPRTAAPWRRASTIPGELPTMRREPL